MGGMISTFCDNVENKAELLTVGLLFFGFFLHHKNSLEFWPQPIFHGIQAGRYFLLNTGKEKITGCLPTGSGLMELPLKCQLWSNVPAALMIYKNSSVCVCLSFHCENGCDVCESQMILEPYNPPKPPFYFGCLAVTT